MDAIFKIESFDNFQTAVTELLKQNRSSREYCNTEIPINDIEAAKEDLRKILINCNFDIKEISHQILGRNWDQNRAQYVISLIEETKTELFYSVITHYNSTYGDTVTDCKWFLKLVLGSSESKVVRYPIMQLVLSTVNSNSQTKLSVYELNKEALSSLINKLESGLDEFNS